ncbi:hypothetical protein PENTCL1PPCAC_24205 [Pristionchus entomophagus]|uniref:Uncharacterized protein n=1 Tax=Pristionchus entomophagus TaxID=358040 RepID=A0AAV5U6C8_9BILA|nr:hypothetical protein PENTCL1PPCAC_24205 [Pristionchus entomophagus]
MQIFKWSAIQPTSSNCAIRTQANRYLMDSREPSFWKFPLNWRVNEENKCPNSSRDSLSSFRTFSAEHASRQFSRPESWSTS